MARIDNLINEIGDERVRQAIAGEVKKLRDNKKFGLVFENHLPELSYLYSVPVKKGAKGKLELTDNKRLFYIPENSPFAVLLKESHFAEFYQAIADREDLTHVFLVTDSKNAFRQMSEEIKCECETVMLYKNYLDNFRATLAVGCPSKTFCTALRLKSASYFLFILTFYQ